jgi:hypothetical protein
MIWDSGEQATVEAASIEVEDIMIGDLSEACEPVTGRRSEFIRFLKNRMCKIKS